MIETGRGTGTGSERVAGRILKPTSRAGMNFTRVNMMDK